MPTTCRCCLMSTRGRCGYTLSIWSRCYEQKGIKTQPRNPTSPTAQGSDQEPPYLRLSRSPRQLPRDRKSTRLNSSHVAKSYAVLCSNKKINKVFIFFNRN